MFCNGHVNLDTNLEFKEEVKTLYLHFRVINI